VALAERDVERVKEGLGEVEGVDELETLGDALEEVQGVEEREAVEHSVADALTQAEGELVTLEEPVLLGLEVPDLLRVGEPVLEALIESLFVAPESVDVMEAEGEALGLGVGEGGATEPVSVLEEEGEEVTLRLGLRERVKEGEGVEDWHTVGVKELVALLEIFGEGVGEPVEEPLTELDCEALGHGDGLIVTEGEALGQELAEELPVAPDELERLGDGEEDLLPEGLSVAEPHLVAGAVVEGEREGEGLPEGEALPLPEALRVPLTEGQPEGVGKAVRTADAELDKLAEKEGAEGEATGEAQAVELRETEALTE
jgi:hypothetical protein